MPWYAIPLAFLYLCCRAAIPATLFAGAVWFLEPVAAPWVWMALFAFELGDTLMRVRIQVVRVDEDEDDAGGRG
jgi:hypothetical protein